MLVGITFLGEVVFASDLFRATGYDAHFWMDTRHLHPQLPFERNIGDGHFTTCPQFDAPFARTGGRDLTPLEAFWNACIQLVRSRIEHMNKMIKKYRMFAGEPFRGYMRNLSLFTKITLHGAAVEMRSRMASRDRYEPFGYWAHS